VLILNKILPLFVLPVGFSLLCIFSGLFLRKKGFIVLGAMVLWFLGTPLASDFLMSQVEGKPQRMLPESVRSADAIVVLGGMIDQIEGAPLGEWDDTVDRFEGGVNLFKAGKAPVLLFTRGVLPWQKNVVPEGELLAARARNLAIPEDAIFLTEKATNTADEAKATGKLLGVIKGKPRKIILVTSAFHMRRAKMQFEKAGFEVEPYRVDYRVSGKDQLTVLSFFPSAVALKQSETALREMIGWVFYKLLHKTNFS